MAALLCGRCLVVPAQEERGAPVRGMFYPAPMEVPWHFSVGVLTVTTPEELTEEVRVRVPAVDLHVLRNITGGFSAEGRALVQVLQNNFSAGLRWNTALNERFHFGVSDEASYWFGVLDLEGFRARATGWTNRPGLSLGYHTRGDLLITLKAEALITTTLAYDVDGQRVVRDTDRLSGGAWSIYLEQPFFKKRSITLGFTAVYTKFLWATWALFQTTDKPIFYPLITIGFIF
ncbi:MAG TPA: hypothetical protein VHL57_06740 [Flavobacteriales bacterium]|jgi:hypothetical protein|nr:hypothetical protein [Flavobacteriales bacterium]